MGAGENLPAMGIVRTAVELVAFVFATVKNMVIVLDVVQFLFVDSFDALVVVAFMPNSNHVSSLMIVGVLGPTPKRNCFNPNTATELCVIGFSIVGPIIKSYNLRTTCIDSIIRTSRLDDVASSF